MNTLCVLLALCCTCLATGVQATCDSYAPHVCTFEWPDSCNWIMTPHWTIYNYPANQHSLGLSGHHSSLERLESGTACATNYAVHCLKLRYRFEENGVLDLSVFINTRQRGKLKVWEVSGSRGWEAGHVPISTISDFNVVIEARSSDARRVFIDTISYERNACDILPADAVPQPPVIIHPPTRQPTKQPTPSTATTVTAGTTNSTTQSQTGQPDSEASFSRNVVLIVVAVVAGVLVVVVGVVLCILFRRKQFRDWKTCCRQPKPKEESVRVDAWPSAPHGGEGNEAARFISVDINGERSEGDVQWPGPRDTSPTPSSPTEHFYSTIDSPAGNGKFQFSTAERVQGHNPDKRNRRNLHPGSVGNPYKITDCSEVLALFSTALDDDYRNLKFSTTDGRDQEDVLRPSAEQNSGYNHLTSNETETDTPSLSADGGTKVIPRTPNLQRAGALYQNVPSLPHSPQHQRRPPAPAHVLREDSDLLREDRSVGVDHLPKASKPGPFPDPVEVHELPVPKSQDPSNAMRHVLKERTPTDLCLEGSQILTNGHSGPYHQLDFEGKNVDGEKGDGVPFMMYSHLNEGSEGMYNEIDRDRRRKVIDEDYCHI